MRLAIIVGGVCALMLVGTAIAHVNENSVTFWRSNDPQLYEKCGTGLGNVAHGIWGHGFARADTYSVRFEPAFGTPCAFPDGRNANHIRARFTYQRKTNGQWAFCDNSNYQHNGEGDWKVEVYRNYGNAPCTKGYYRNIGSHGVLVGGNWQVGETHPQEHYFD